MIVAWRYLAIACMFGLLTLTFTSGWVRRHVGWMACAVNLVVVGYLCAMLYATDLAADSLIASFVGVLICGMVLHRAAMVVVFMSVAATSTRCAQRRTSSSCSVMFRPGLPIIASARRTLSAMALKPAGSSEM